MEEKIRMWLEIGHDTLKALLLLFFLSAAQFFTLTSMRLLFSQAYFSQPMVAAAVLVHLVTDGTYYLDQKQETIGVQLFDTKEQSHDLGKTILFTPLFIACLTVPLFTNCDQYSCLVFPGSDRKSACLIVQDLSLTGVCWKGCIIFPRHFSTPVRCFQKCLVPL